MAAVIAKVPSHFTDAVAADPAERVAKRPPPRERSKRRSGPSTRGQHCALSHHSYVTRPSFSFFTSPSLSFSLSLSYPEADRIACRARYRRRKERRDMYSGRISDKQLERDDGSLDDDAPCCRPHGAWNGGTERNGTERKWRREERQDTERGLRGVAALVGTRLGVGSFVSWTLLLARINLLPPPLAPPLRCPLDGPFLGHPPSNEKGGLGCPRS